MSDADQSPGRLDVDLLTLRTLVAIADEGSFSGAARRIHRTQSAVSLQIARLEERLQVKLLERTSRKVERTPAGDLLIGYARQILALADEAALALGAPESAAPLRVGFAEYLAPDHLHGLLARFQRAHPRSAVELTIDTGVALGDALAAGALDVVVAGPDAAGGGEGGFTLFEEPMVWIAGETATVPADGPTPLVLMQPPCSYRAVAFGALQGASRTWRVAVEANAIQGVQSAVRAGLGVSAVALSVAGPGLRIVEEGLPALPTTAMIARRAAAAHPLTDRFLDYLRDNLGRGDMLSGARTAAEGDATWPLTA